MAAALRTGLRLVVLTTPAEVAVLVLLAAPGAVVGVVLCQDHRRTTGGPTTSGLPWGHSAGPAPEH